MNFILELMGVSLSALLAENFILVSCLGIGTRTRSFRDPVDAMRTGLCLTLVMMLSAGIAWFTDFLILNRFGLPYFRLFLFALLVPTLVYGLNRFFQVCIPALYQKLHENLSSIATNCAALGCAWMVSQRSYDLITALCFALFGGIGATIVLASFANLLGEVDLEHCPTCFRGIPMQLITAGLMAMALIGFYGLHID